MEWPTFANAPIVEATISIGIVPPDTLQVRDLSAISDIVGDKFTMVSEEHFYAGEVNVPNVGDPPEHQDVHGHIGYLLHGPEGNRLRVTVDGFEYSVGQPYDKWATFRDEALELWEIYKNVAEATEISRLELRYINRIDIPNTREAKLDDYFTVYLEIPEGWPGGTALRNFFVQFQIDQEDLDCLLIVNQAPAPSPERNMVSVRLDFDLIKEMYDQPWSMDDEKSVWTLLDRMRVRKNELFRESITQMTEDLIS